MAIALSGGIKELGCNEPFYVWQENNLLVAIE